MLDGTKQGSQVTTYTFSIDDLNYTEDIGTYKCIVKDDLNRSGTGELYFDRIFGIYNFFKFASKLYIEDFCSEAHLWCFPSKTPMNRS